MSCVGPVMYQPYSSTAPATPSLYSAVTSPVSPDHTHHTPTTHPPSSFHLHQEHQGPLSLKREIIEKQYKLETDPLAPTPADPAVVERRVGGPVGGPPQPRENITFPSPTRQGGHGGPGSVSGSCGTPGPRTPVTPRPDSQQDRDSDGEGDESGGRSAVYLSRNVILYTHYAGEVANIVDEHFSKALNQSPVSFQKKITPMASRNLPPSFFNAHYHARYPSGPSEASSVGLYSDYSTTPGLHHHLAGVGSSLTGSPDPWQYAAQASASCSYHRSVQDLVNSATSSSQHYSPTNTANSIQAAQSRLQSQYSSLFLGASNSALSRPGSSMVSVKSETPWVGGGGVGQEYHTHPVPDFSHSIDRNYSPHHYPNMTPTGLEATGQEASKDLYWPTF